MGERVGERITRRTELPAHGRDLLLHPADFLGLVKQTLGVGSLVGGQRPILSVGLLEHLLSLLREA